MTTGRGWEEVLFYPSQYILLSLRHLEEKYFVRHVHSGRLSPHHYEVSR